MRDDLASPNLGSAPKEYNATFFNRALKGLELVIARFLSKGPVQITELTVDDITVTDDVTVAGDLAVTGTSTLTGAVTAGGNASVGGNLAVTGTSTLTGNTTVGGTLGVTGLCTLGSLTVTGAFALAGDDVQVSEGGTGASTATGARTNLGVAIGSDVQAWDADLDSLAASFGTGFGVRTTTSTWELRSLTSSSNHLTITNPAGIAGDPVLNLAVGAIQAGTYTPTITSVANIDSTSGPDGMYVRIGNIVIVFGTVVIDATAAASTLTSIGISLPIASNFAATADASGIIGSQAGTTGRVIGDSVNDRVQANYSSATTAASTFHFQFMYEVI